MLRYLARLICWARGQSGKPSGRGKQLPPAYVSREHLTQAEKLVLDTFERTRDKAMPPKPSGPDTRTTEDPPRG